MDQTLSPVDQTFRFSTEADRSHPFAVYQEGYPAATIHLWDRIGVVPGGEHNGSHPETTPTLLQYDQASLCQLDACIETGHYPTEPNLARAVAIYLCDWLVGKVDGAHWQLEPTGWAWLALPSGARPDPYLAVVDAIASKRGVAQRFSAVVAKK